jgi:hypothetical protein
MIFSLPPGLKCAASEVIHEGQPVSYSWGNEAALHQWIADMNKKQINKALGLSGAKKYPLIWLVQGWKAKQDLAGYKFEKVIFYISSNSKIETLNEARVPNFELLYSVANDFIKQLRFVVKIAEKSIAYEERPNFSVKKGKDGQAITVDVWDTLIVEMELIVNTNCLKKLCSL